ncbi:MAG: RidA family protein [Gammaproteobacteria bacterium]|nr:RidA family protein [Gammaproteobacteria bacterium]
MKAEENVYKLGITLPDVPGPAGQYAHFVRSGNLLYLSGKGPFSTDGSPVSGKVGTEVTADQARVHARSVGLIQLATIRQALGTLDNVKQVVKVLGMVNAAPDFEQHPFVIDGFSELMIEVFGNGGRGARSAVGMGSLPFGITVEIEAIIEIDTSVAEQVYSDTP